MPELRAVLVMVPPLLADLIRHVIASRVGGVGEARLRIVEINDPAATASVIAPDIVILGHAAAVAPWAGPRWPPHVRVLSLSPDLTRLLGPDPGDDVPFTPDALTARLRDLVRTI